MAKRVIWKPNVLVSLKLRDNLFTIGQILNKVIMQFFDISNSDGVWKNVDLNKTPMLFRAFVLRAPIDGRITEKTVIPNFMPKDRYWIYPYSPIHKFYPGKYWERDGENSFAFMGGELVDLGENFTLDSCSGILVKENLRLPEDKDIIEKYELTNMWSSESLTQRLVRYFDTGINRDDAKFEVFPGLWNDREKLRPLTCRLPIPFR
jgi:hypothetical protein